MTNDKKVIFIIIVFLSMFFSTCVENMQEHTDIQKQLIRMEAKQDSILLKFKK